MVCPAIRLTDCSQLQSVMNAAARLVLSAWKYEHVTPLLRDLHWLWVPEQIEFKLAVLVFRCLHSTAPTYLADELDGVTDSDSGRRLCSASTSALMVLPTRRMTIGDRAFLVCGAHVWNALPSFVTDSANVATFKSHLKTYLFARSLSWDRDLVKRYVFKLPHSH